MQCEQGREQIFVTTLDGETEEVYVFTCTLHLIKRTSYHLKDIVITSNSQKGHTLITWIWSFSVYKWLLFVLLVVCNMAHFMVYCCEVLLIDRSTHLDP